MKREDERPEDRAIGRFSRGQEHEDDGGTALRQVKPRFSRGQERAPSSYENHREGRFSTGQEHPEGVA